MYCENCGAEIKDGNQFCTKCGARVIEDTDFNTFDFTSKLENGIFDNTAAYQTDNMDLTRFNTGTTSFDTTGQYVKPKKKKTGLIIFLVFLLLLLLAGGAFAGYWFFLRQKSVNIEDFISVKVDKKLEGYASAEVDIDYKKLTNIIGYKNLKKALINGMSEKELKEYQKEKDFKIDTATETKSGKEALNAENFIIAEVGQTTNLSNDDKIVIRLLPADNLDYDSFEDLMKVLKIKLDDSYVYTVSGLESGKKIDVMIPGVEKYVSFYGIEGSGTAKLNITSEKYTFENVYEVEVVNNMGKVYKNGSYVGALNYMLITMNGEPASGNLSEGDQVSVTAIPDENLTQVLIDDKLSIEKNAATIKVGKLGSYVDPSSLSSQQLVNLSEDVVLLARNTYHEGCPDLKALYQMKDKNSSNDYAIGYLFKTNKNEYFFIHKKVYMSADGNTVDSSVPEMLYLGQSQDSLNSKLSNYDLKQIDDKGVGSAKYAVGKNAVVLVKGLNVRSGPGVKYDQVKINGKVAYDEGEVLEVVDEQRDVDNDLWYQVKFYRNGKEYKHWASGMYVELYDPSTQY